jgi:hypothetical protein
VFVGVADLDTTINQVIDGVAVAGIKTDLHNQWSYDLNTTLAAGTHTVAATAINRAGTASVTATTRLTIDTPAQQATMTNVPAPLFDTA